MKIAICDDFDLDRNFLSDKLQKIRPAWHYSDFNCGEDLIAAIEKKNTFDLIFLDIFMTGMNGLETAKSLRALDCKSAIIFTTSSRDFAVESYRVEAFSYLLKPISDEELLLTIERYEAHIRPQQILLGNHLVNANSVLYLESQDKKVVAFFDDNTTLEWRAKLTEVEASLECKQFIRCHRSFIVNIDAVRRVEGGTFILSKDIHIPIRRQAVAEVTKKYYFYITS